MINGMLDEILIAFTTITLYFLVMRNISSCKANILHLCAAVITTTIFSSALFIYDPRLEIFGSVAAICIATIFLAWHTKTIILSGFYAVLGMIVLMLSVSLSNFLLYLFSLIVGDNQERIGFREDMEYITLIEYITIYVLALAISYAISKHLGSALRRVIAALYASLDKKYIAYILLILLFSLIFFYASFFITPNNYGSTTQMAIIGTITNLFYFFILNIALYSFFTGLRTHMQNSHNQELLKVHQDYINNLEALYGEMRKFRHDNVNILLGIYGYIQNRDIDGLESYFNNKIIPLRDYMNNSSNTLDKLKELRIPEIKGLLMVKIMQAQDQGINMHVVIKEPIETIDFDMLDFTRILGILLDNAIEASLESSDPYIKFAFLREESSYFIAIANPFGPTSPSVSKVFEKDFSTKGEGRGLGLFTVRQILDQKANAVLSTYIKNEEFIQEIRLGNVHKENETESQHQEVQSA